MTNKEFIILINGLENSFPVHKLEYKNVKIWPFLRMLYAERLVLSKHRNTNDGHPGSEIRIRQVFAIIKRLMLTLLAYPFTKQKINKLNARKTSGTQVLSFFEINAKYQKLDSKHFNKFIDPIRRLTEVKILEMENNPDEKIKLKEDIIDISLYIKHAILNYSWLAMKKKIFGSKHSIKYFSEFDMFLNEKNADLKIPEELIIKELDLLLSFRNSFLTLLKLFRPKYVFIGCFYQIKSMALVLACRDLKIRTIELQHGQQGDHHVMYTHWNNVPDSGYDLIPSHFWLWGGHSYERIKFWIRNNTFHKAFVGGNPWLSYKLNAIQSEIDECEFCSYLKEIKSKKVLITLQPIENPLPEF